MKKSIANQPKKMTASERKAYVAGLLPTVAGRKVLAAQLNEPLKTLRDYEAVGRNLVMIDQLGQGELPVYDHDPKITAFVVAEDGSNINPVTKTKRVTVPLIEIKTAALAGLADIQTRRYSLLDRFEQLVKDRVIRKEDEIIFNAMSSIAQSANGNPVIAVPAANVSVDHLDEAVSVLEGENYEAKFISMNPVNKKILRRNQRNGNQQFTPAFNDEAIKNKVGDIFGCEVLASIKVPKDEILVSAEKEYVGVLATAIDLQVLSVEDTLNHRVGFSALSLQGILFHNAKAISKIKLT